jgi:hypothetical protein
MRELVRKAVGQEEKAVMTSTPRKVAKLPLNVIEGILDRAEIRAQASEVGTGVDSPVSKPQRLLPEGIIDALTEANRREYLIEGGRKMVALRPDEIPVLTAWLRSLADQPRMTAAERTMFRDAAAAVERAE